MFRYKVRKYVFIIIILMEIYKIKKNRVLIGVVRKTYPFKGKRFILYLIWFFFFFLAILSAYILCILQSKRENLLHNENWTKIYVGFKVTHECAIRKLYSLRVFSVLCLYCNNNICARRSSFYDLLFYWFFSDSTT